MFALQIARGQLHATGLQMGMATAAPAVGYLFATFWARQMEGRSKLPFVTITWLCSRGLFLLTPLLVQGALARPMLLALICITPIVFSVSTPAYTAIIKEIYPDQLRGRLMSYVRICMSAAMMLTAWVAGWLQEHHGLRYQYLFCVGGIFGIGTAFAFSRLRLPRAAEASTPPPIGAFLRATFGILVHNRGYRWFTMSVFIAGFGNLVANTLYPIYQVDHFHVTPTQIAGIGFSANIMALCSLFFFGWYMDRFGSLQTVLLCYSILFLQPILYAAAPNVHWLYAAAAAGGIAQAGIDIGYLNTTLTFAEPGRAAQYQAVHSSFFGLRGTVAPLLAVHILHALGGAWKTSFLLCFLIMLVGATFQVFSMQSYRRAQREQLRT